MAAFGIGWYKGALCFFLPLLFSTIYIPSGCALNFFPIVLMLYALDELALIS